MTRRSQLGLERRRLAAGPLPPPPPPTQWVLPPPPAQLPLLAFDGTEATLTVREWFTQAWATRMEPFYRGNFARLELGVRRATDGTGTINGNWLPSGLQLFGDPEEVADWLPPAPAPHTETASNNATSDDYVFVITIENPETGLMEDWFVSAPFTYTAP